MPHLEKWPPRDENQREVYPHLRKLTIEDCHKLVSFAEGMLENPRALTLLRIGNCGEPVFLPDGLQKLTSLVHLEILNCDSLKSVPEELQYLSSVEILEIKYFKQLELSKQNLTALRSLEIFSCKNLMMFPEGLQHLRCFHPYLYVQCERDGWPKLSHNPDSRLMQLGIFDVYELEELIRCLFSTFINLKLGTLASSKPTEHHDAAIYTLSIARKFQPRVKVNTQPKDKFPASHAISVVAEGSINHDEAPNFHASNVKDLEGGPGLASLLFG
ncbi:hypothetical protein IFM89_000962 [Coptis chinensis]|uniref:Disease resistance protein n=1 Tax=Coptis chinensis TaxID=261450 RepID=A0A835IKW7_9MAGN|nr:hypothetical protein IFM89_000962 [Coptis chinensis]